MILQNYILKQRLIGLGFRIIAKLMSKMRVRSNLFDQNRRSLNRQFKDGLIAHQGQRLQKPDELSLTDSSLQEL